MKRFVIIITMLAYFSACGRNTTTTMIPLESVEPVACQPILGVILTDNQQVDFSPPDGRYVRKGKTVEGIVNDSDSVSYRLGDIQTILMPCRTSEDSVMGVPVEEFKSSHKKWDKLSGYRISAAGRRDSRPIRFIGESGRLNCADYTLSGVLNTGDLMRLSIDSVSVVKVTNARVLPNALVALVVVSAVALVLIVLAFAKLEDRPIGPINW